MAITLRIDNLDQLPDGGPMEFSAGSRGFDIGREQHLDWTLPDPGRTVSGLHCSIRYENGSYLLHDVSRNGTFVNGSPSRVRSPYRLANGDRLQIGPYFIQVMMSGGDDRGADFGRPDDAAGFDAAPAQGGDIWSGGNSTPEAVDRKWFANEQRRGQRAPDVLQNFVELPQARSPGGGGDDSPFGATGVSPQLRNVPGSQIGGGWSAPATTPPDFQQRPNATGVGRGPEGRSAPPGGDRQLAGFIGALCAAAGISVETLGQRSPDDIANELGSILRIVTEQLGGLLKARAAAKLMTKSSNRTMVGADNNNALKFAPTAGEALSIMLERKRPGYLGAAASFQEGFEDIKSHEFATYSAMQKALAMLMTDLSPDQIEDKAGGAGFGSKKAKAWELYVERWNAKTEHRENGILDLYLEYFRTAYDAAAKRGP